MKRGVKYIILAVFVASFLAIGSVHTFTEKIPRLQTKSYALSNTDGYDFTLKIIIDDAHYEDDDLDGYEDDIVTTFRILLADTPDEWDSGQLPIWVDTILQLPSGLVYEYIFDLTTFNGVAITMVWIDAAVESGWYDFSIHVGGYTDSIKGDFEIISFDPPTAGNPGPPQIDMTIVEIPDQF